MEVDSGANIGDETPSKKAKVVVMGNKELDALWNLTLTLDDSEKYPSIATMVQHVIKDLQNPDEMSDVGPTKSKTYQWKITRLLASQRYPVIKQLNTKTLEEVLVDNAGFICPALAQQTASKPTDSSGSK